MGPKPLIIKAPIYHLQVLPRLPSSGLGDQMLDRPCTVPEATIRLASIARAGCSARQEFALAAFLPLAHFRERCFLESEGSEASAKLCRSAPLQAQQGRHGGRAAAEAGRSVRAAPSAGPLSREPSPQALGQMSESPMPRSTFDAYIPQLAGGCCAVWRSRCGLRIARWSRTVPTDTNWKY